MVINDKAQSWQPAGLLGEIIANISANTAKIKQKGWWVVGGVGMFPLSKQGRDFSLIGLLPLHQGPPN